MLLWLVRFLPFPPPPHFEGLTAASKYRSAGFLCLREVLSAQLVPNYRPRIGHRIAKPKNGNLSGNLSAQLVPSYQARFFSWHVGSQTGPGRSARLQCSARRFRCDVSEETANYLFVSDKLPTPRRCADHAPPLMDKREVAEWLNVCSRTIDNWLLEGWMPVIQLTPRIQRFNPLHILAAIEELYGKGHGYQKPQRRKALNVA